MEEVIALSIFELELKDVLALYQNQLLLEVEPGSIFYGKIAESLPSVDVNTLAPELIQALKIAAAPDVYVNQRIGGGGAGLERMRLHSKKSVGSIYVNIVETDVNMFTFMIFETIEQVIEWLLDTLGCKNEDTVPNYFSPKLLIEEFIFMLHVIDYYRRVTFSHMLEHTVESRIVVKYSDFMKDMSVSIASGDIRWLLPAYISMAPGVLDYELKLNYEHANKLFSLGFLEFAGKTDDDEYLVSFGEAGLLSGIEFYRTWFTSFGLEVNVLKEGQYFAMERLFVAPTALTNHFVRLEYEESGQVFVNHQSYTMSQLKQKLIELFSHFA